MRPQYSLQRPAPPLARAPYSLLLCSVYSRVPYTFVFFRFIWKGRLWAVSSCSPLSLSSHSSTVMASRFAVSDADIDLEVQEETVDGKIILFSLFCFTLSPTIFRWRVSQCPFTCSSPWNKDRLGWFPFSKPKVLREEQNCQWAYCYQWKQSCSLWGVFAITFYYFLTLSLFLRRIWEGVHVLRKCWLLLYNMILELSLILKKERKTRKRYLHLFHNFHFHVLPPSLPPPVSQDGYHYGCLPSHSSEYPWCHIVPSFDMDSGYSRSRSIIPPCLPLLLVCKWL